MVFKQVCEEHTVNRRIKFEFEPYKSCRTCVYNMKVPSGFTFLLFYRLHKSGHEEALRLPWEVMVVCVVT